MIRVGKVESRNDPLRLGRMKVRIVGIHTPDKAQLPTDDLPWTLPIQSISSAAMNGIGESPTGAVEGSTVLIAFLDEDEQIPVALGTIGGIPTSVEVDIEPTEYVEQENVSKDAHIETSSESNMYLSKAMDDAGITSPYQRAAIQSICQVESNDFTVLKENLNYKTVDRLLQVFPSAFKNDRTLAAQYINNPDGLAEFVYGKGSKTGKALGNTQPADGRKYIGRGYVQITGRSNYNRIGKAIGADLITTPTLLEQPEIAAKASVQYFLLNVKTPGTSPEYYMAAKKAVGNNTTDISAKKDALYAFYLSNTAQLPQTDKNASPTSTTAELDDFGFQDPNNKYPLPDYLDEPDTNRLARGNYTGTIVTKKDGMRARGIQIANTSSTWSQPESPYNAQYPFNSVKETESGHVTERDDTPGNERTLDYHRMGTFREVDVNGTQVTRIVGDGYEIIDRNGYVSIAGEYNLTVGGQASLLVKADAQIQVFGNLSANVHGNSTINTAGTMNVSATNMNFSAGTIGLEATNLNIKASNYKLTTGEASVRYNGDLHTMIGANTYSRHNVGIDYSCPTDPPRSTDINCSSVDSANAANLVKIGGKTKSTIKFKPLTTPMRKPDAVFVFETPEDLVGSTIPVVDALPVPAAKVEKPAQLKTVVEKAPTCSDIQNLDTFPSSLLLHTDATGYTWTLGKLLNGNSLKEVTVRGRLYTKADIVCNLKSLAENVLGKLNETIGQVDLVWKMSSIYRNSIPAGGSATSQHLYGCAVDVSLGNTAYDMTYDLAKSVSGKFAYDQLILEYLDRGGSRIVWMHIGYQYGNNRNQIMTFLNHSKKTNGLQKLA